jgi:alpha-N-acetylglucosaminidase
MKAKLNDSFFSTVALAILTLLLITLTISAQNVSDANGAQALIARVLPSHANAFICTTIASKDGNDVFEIEAQNGKIVLRGNNSLSIAMAFNWYLRYVAKTDFGWEAAGPLKIEGHLPLPIEKISQTCAARERFFLNYCTYGYTFPFWDWNQWQRFVDWMAMNGINRPLLQCGQEATWLNVWKSYGLSDETVRAFFSGPAHLPWHRMANLDKWGGPLPISYIDGQRKLQVQILARARSLGMKPILAGFAGHVPEAFKTVKPDARIIPIAPGWGGMEPQYATFFLDPTDPLFKDVQYRFINEQQMMYGTDHLYGADPFNEITPPSWEPEYLAQVAKTIYESMADADPETIWYQMSWNFFYDKNWTPPRLKALTLAVPKGKLVYLDYVCEQAEFFKKTDNFYNAPFIWCYIANFGGNTHFVAPLNLISTRSAAAMPIENCLGIGSTLEGLNINPIAYDLLFEQPWHKQAKVNLNDWVVSYATRRAGRPDPAVIEAWQILYKNILIDTPDGLWGRSILLQAVPKYELGKIGTESGLPVKQIYLMAAVTKLLEADPVCRMADGYQFDVVNLTRQALGNCAAVITRRMMRAVVAKDLSAFRHESALLLQLGRDIDTLIGTRHEFLLGRWIADARAWGTTLAEKTYYERNARQILTTWHLPGGGLNDYADRQWNGLMRTYYLGRWKEFLKRLDASLADNTPFDQNAYHQWRVKFDGDWVNSTSEKFSEMPHGDPFKTAKKLFEKYDGELVQSLTDVKLNAAVSSTNSSYGITINAAP